MFCRKPKNRLWWCQTWLPGESIPQTDSPAKKPHSHIATLHPSLRGVTQTRVSDEHICFILGKAVLDVTCNGPIPGGHHAVYPCNRVLRILPTTWKKKTSLSFPHVQILAVQVIRCTQTSDKWTEMLKKSPKFNSGNMNEGTEVTYCLSEMNNRLPLALNLGFAQSA